MSLFVREKNKTNLLINDLEEKIERYKEKNDFYLITILSMIYFIKEFSLDILEIESSKFKNNMDILSSSFSLNDNTKKTKKSFEKYKNMIVSFIQSEKEYLDEKDEEFKRIIALLTNGLYELGQDNNTFTSKLQERSVRIEEIRQLNDIRKIKEELQQELNQLKQAVRDKQARDTEHVATLSHKVESLTKDFVEAQTAAMKDGLTGAFNREAFDEHLSTLVGRHRVTPTPFALLLLGIDDFKQINDTYGHPVGDRVLTALVQQCSSVIRKGDLLARYEGDEFVIILGGASLRHAFKKGRELCKAIASARYVVDINTPHERLAFTVSIGVSSIAKDDTVETILERASKALYEAKSQGKNRAISGKRVA